MEREFWKIHLSWDDDNDDNDVNGDDDDDYDIGLSVGGNNIYTHMNKYICNKASQPASAQHIIIWHLKMYYQCCCLSNIHSNSSLHKFVKNIRFTSVIPQSVI